jgi:hypothetical protein
MRAVGFILSMAIIASACGGQPEEPSAKDELRDQCAQLRDHLIAIDTANVANDREAHRAALARALGDHFVDDCAAKQSAADVSCALIAGSLEAAAHCEGSPATTEVTP